MSRQVKEFKSNTKKNQHFFYGEGDINMIPKKISHTGDNESLDRHRLYPIAIAMKKIY